MKRFLSKMNRAIEIAPEAGVPWDILDGGLDQLKKYASALEVGDVVVNYRIKSVPSPWARLLLFREALFDKYHPAHETITSEWRGLLGAIALAEYLGSTVEASEVRWSEEGDGVLSELTALSPQPSAGVWNRFALIRIGGVLAGATSPATLVFTGFRPATEIPVPFKSGDERLKDPVPFYRKENDMETLRLLTGWIEQCRQDVAGQEESLRGLADNAALNSLLEQLDAWRRDARRELGIGQHEEVSAVEMSTSPFSDFAGRAPFAAYSQLRPLKPGEGRGPACDLVLQGSENTAVDPGADGVILGPDDLPYTGRIQLGRGFPVEVENGRLPGGAVLDRSPFKLVLGDLQECFEPKLLPVKDVVTEQASALQLKNGTTYLLPFSAEILQQLTPTQLANPDWVHAEGSPAVGVSVFLDIPVQNNLKVRWTQVVPGDKILNRANSPTLAVWPDFEDEEWKHYHFVVKHAAAEDQIQFLPAGPPSEDMVPPKNDPAGQTTWGRTTRWVDAWQGSLESARGLLIAGKRKPAGPRAEDWHVSIDFGSTHTRVFMKRTGDQGGAVEPVPIQPRSIPLLGGKGVLSYDFFPPAGEEIGDVTELRTMLRLPAGPIAAHTDAEDWLPIQGLIYWKALHGDDEGEGLHPNLKWHESTEDRPAFESYAHQLLLSILAEAHAKNARVKSIKTAFPSVFPQHIRNAHRHVWETMCKRFGKLQFETPLPEAHALAAYFKNKAGSNPSVSLLAIDVGGSTADLAVWGDGALQANDSVRMAGEILGRLVSTSEKARTAFEKAAHELNEPQFKWHTKQDLNGPVLNSLLRRVEASYEETDRLAELLYQGPDSPGAWVLAHLGFLFATLNYLLGLMVRRQDSAVPEYTIQLGGRGSQYLRWLKEFDYQAATDIPISFFLAGLALDGESPQTPVNLELPAEHTAKQEVGRGLLMGPVAEPVPPQQEHSTFVGERGFEMEEQGAIEWSTTITARDVGTLVLPAAHSVSPDQYQFLHKFVQTFLRTSAGQKILRALEIDDTDIPQAVAARIHEKVFGHGGIRDRAQDDNERANVMVEPLFITGAKTYLEVMTGNPGLFIG